MTFFNIEYIHENSMIHNSRRWSDNISVLSATFEDTCVVIFKKEIFWFNFLLFDALEIDNASIVEEDAKFDEDWKKNLN